jgi:hypothetical protein
MLLINYSHPITDEQFDQLCKLLNTKGMVIKDVPCHLDIEESFAPQVVALADAAGLSPTEWQAYRIVVNLPALSTAAALLLAELHGRMGYYPPAVRLRKEGGPPPMFVVVELLDFDEQRQSARGRR